MGCRPAILIPFTLYKASRLNLLWLSEPVPIGIGVSVEKERAILLLTAVALQQQLSATGGIAFVGLRVPHFARALVGPRNQLFLPVAIQIRAWLHTIGRNILELTGIPAGIMISLIGAPYFMYLLTKSRRKSTIIVKAEDVFSFFCLPYHLQISGAAKIGT
ncbi:iron compound ABC transporter permease [Peribacillus simplex]|uniref:Iron compound ABC transporter permease n=1 Tax=Peribacillus simplex TaxID=1478 RepID=A0AAN2PI68_9BACI|nr:iron compound ABC transporter permease [Peribacillus simplex]